MLLLVMAACSRGPVESVQVPELRDADYHWIASRIFQNETRGRTRFLTHWNAGEEFPSLGIGHFIWFPAGVDAPFDESFPAMVAYVRERSDECSPVPPWLLDLDPFDAPWASKDVFDRSQQSDRMIELRQWLSRTAPTQVRYIVTSFGERWNALDMSAERKNPRTAILQRLMEDPRGVFAAIDYFNFKGLGSNPRERYNGEGWGLAQVLGDVVGAETGEDADLVALFSDAAANRLRLRVGNSPPERNEKRWLAGWERRVASYTLDVPQLAGPPDSAYRITPYLQKVGAHEATISWFSERPTSGRVTLRGGVEETRADERVIPSTPQIACDLGYHLAEYAYLEGAHDRPYKHEIRVDGLVAGREYRFVAVQDGETATGRFRTPGAAGQGAHFVVLADTETEPESTGTPVNWPEPGKESKERWYLIDQTDGYAANLAVIAERQPDFIAIAGDLVEAGGEQRDWDEFWRQTAKLAASVPIVPAMGNHDYYGGPGELDGYSAAGTARAYRKFRTYFGGRSYYVLDHGPIALIVVDAVNGVPDLSGADTNFYMVSHDEVAPPWNAGPQREWLEQALAEAQRDKAFTFVMLHAAPYTSGVHGKRPGLDSASDPYSGLPLRELTPLFMQYGVDAVFSGHDEMYEHSSIAGTELLADGSQAGHTLHFFTIGIAGDGLRGPDPSVQNPHRVFLAHEDAPEVYDEDGILVDGGKHYGHLEVTVTLLEDGKWQAQFEPVYVLQPANERRVYDDSVVLESRIDNE